MTRKLCVLMATLLAGVSALAQSAATPAKLLVKNAFILTMAPGQREPVKGYLVVGEDGRLSAVAAGDPPAGLNAKQTLDAEGHWVTPGFISAHSHLWQSAFRGLGADKTLMGWIDALYTPAVKASPEDMYWFTLDGALDHLEHGITAAFNFNYEARTRGRAAVRVGGPIRPERLSRRNRLRHSLRSRRLGRPGHRTGRAAGIWHRAGAAIA